MFSGLQRQRCWLALHSATDTTQSPLSRHTSRLGTTLRWSRRKNVHASCLTILPMHLPHMLTGFR